MTTSEFLLAPVPRADTLPGRPAYPSLQPMPRAARSSKTTAAVVMQNSDEPPEDLMSMNQHELETAHSRALIEALMLKNEEIDLATRGKCPVLAHAKAVDAMERVMQITLLGIMRFGGDEEAVEWIKDEYAFERIVRTPVCQALRISSRAPSLRTLPQRPLARRLRCRRSKGTVPFQKGQLLSKVQHSKRISLQVVWCLRMSSAVVSCR